MASFQEPPQIVTPILGMHRSGTSMLTRMLNLMGIQLGWQLQSPSFDNPKGFWENRFFQTLNMRLLSSVGCNPNGLDSPIKLEETFKTFTHYPLSPNVLSTIDQYIKSIFTGSHWGWKDPRTVITWPFWDRCLRELGYADVRPIVLLRRPNACLASLKKRGDVKNPFLRDCMDEDDYIVNLWGTYYELIDSYISSATLILKQEDLIDLDAAAGEMLRCSCYLDLDKSRISPALAAIDTRLISHHRENISDSTRAKVAKIHDTLIHRNNLQRDRFKENLTAQPTAVQPNASSLVHGHFCIYVVSPNNHIHSQAFEDLALGLHHAFSQLGYRAPIVHYDWEISGTPIVLGANLLPYNQGIKIPTNSIIFNLEQIFEGSPWLNQEYLELLKRHQVWDFSKRNIEELAKLEVTQVIHCGIGYLPELSSVQQLPEADLDIDVLFYGIPNDRRLHILDDLKQRSVKVASCYDVYGKRRNRLIARTKIVINIHFYESKVLEIVRLSHLLANKKFIISERGKDRQMERPFEKGIVFSEYDSLVAACLEYLHNSRLRKAVALKGYEIFRSYNQTEFLKDAIDQTVIV